MSIKFYLAYQRTLLCSLVGLILCLCATPAHATVNTNMGVPYWGGQLAAEPTGLEAVAILRETLTIDLRGLANDEPAQVEAIYQLDNQGAAQTVNLLFATFLRTIAAVPMVIRNPINHSRRPSRNIPAAPKTVP